MCIGSTGCVGQNTLFGSTERNESEGSFVLPVLVRV